MRDWLDWFFMLVITAAVAVTLMKVFVDMENESAEAARMDAVTVVVDAGHGGSDGGAVGSGSGVPEAGLNLAVAERLAALLQENGLTVIMTRSTGAALADTKRGDMQVRKTILSGPDVDLVVSIHMNKFTDPAVSGAMAYYMLGSEEGRRLAQQLIDALCDATGRPRRLANPGDYFVLRECPAPAALVECGFLSNASEEKKLLQPEYQQLLAEAVAKGVLAYLAQEE